ncbi:hypothetical protein LTR62_000469 [Meristemomyces frigidus]|uniref:Uncharacterized protein n=1 Tax=Meristemomyces frigidus TaxID=1508187 RepID=A0AAN7YM50_9PEZI|nr:hypothetical protein LTR62_000469 [Meristemomyces frigidus]
MATRSKSASASSTLSGSAATGTEGIPPTDPVGSSGSGDAGGGTSSNTTGANNSGAAHSGAGAVGASGDFTIDFFAIRGS